MLRTRLWMGAILILLTVGVLLVDAHLAPWHPFLFLLVFGLSLIGVCEFMALLGPTRRPWPWLSYASVTALIVANWPVHLWDWAREIAPSSFQWVLATYAGIIVVGFLAAMASFQAAEESNPRQPGSDTISRLALLMFLTAYLGILPGFIAQLRWPSRILAGEPATQAAVSLALAIFVPKICDSGAYFTGRALGKHKMTPVLSPKKTWEGLVGGLLTAMLGAFLLNRLGPVLRGGDLAALGFGLTVGVAGVFGDLAESLVKRECRQKDASQVMPGFGGVLDVVDSIIYAAPVAYCWLA